MTTPNPKDVSCVQRAVSITNIYIIMHCKYVVPVVR